MGLTVAILGDASCVARNGHVTSSGADHDQRFLVETLDHLMHDLKVARACPDKDIRAELREFCRQLFVDQDQEREKMAAWLREWYQKAPREDPWTVWLEAQDGELFERQFLKTVLKGHRDVAKRAAECTKSAKHTELAQFCQEVAAHRTQEARQMETWNCEWFGEC